MALFSRVTIWVSNQVLTASALNGEFNNILNNAMASSWIGFSANVSQMQQQTDPGGVGTESLAGSISDELQRLRFMLAFTLGKTYWYDHTGRSFAVGSLAVLTADIADDAVTTPKIADAAVTSAKIAPGVLVPVPQDFYTGVFPMGASNYWTFDASGGAYTTANTIGTPVALTDIYKIGFSSVSTPTGNKPGVSFTAPATGTIEIKVAGYFQSGAIILALELFETTGSVILDYAGSDCASTKQWIPLEGFLPVTSGQTYNVIVRGAVNTGTVTMGGDAPQATPQAAATVKMKYVKGL